LAVQDTVVGFLILAVIVAAVLWIHPGGPSQAMVAPPVSSIVSNKGVTHEKSPSRSRKNSKLAAARKSHRSSEPSQQGEALPSIYDSKKVKAAKAQKVVHGVPLDSFVQNSINTLPGEVPAEAPNRVRVFLQCVELRPGKSSELSEKECNELIARNSPNGKRFGTLGGL
jgi:hypothetical protein